MCKRCTGICLLIKKIIYKAETWTFQQAKIGNWQQLSEIKFFHISWDEFCLSSGYTSWWIMMKSFFFFFSRGSQLVSHVTSLVCELRSVQTTALFMADNDGCEREREPERGQGGVSVWVECVWIVCWQWENNSSWVHKTEEGFSSAWTVLTPLSQSGRVAKCAVNLPLLCCRVGAGHTHTHLIDSKFIVWK